MQQIAPFGAVMHLGEEVTGLRRQDNGRFALEPRPDQFDAVP